MQLEVSAKTHKGMVRASNQDSFLNDDDLQLYVVADGMGGHAGGEIASFLCVDHLKNYLRQNIEKLNQKDSKLTDAEYLATLGQGINHASTIIYQRALEDPKLKGMGTTATAIKIHDKKCYISHVGDSRLYLIRQGYIYQMTLDHSLVSEQVRLGIISKEEAEQHHLKNVITRCVGFQEEEDVDTSTLDIEDGDLFALCSDGLHGKLKDFEICQISLSDFSTATTKLIDLANERGGEDNITVLLIKVKLS